MIDLKEIKNKFPLLSQSLQELFLIVFNYFDLIFNFSSKEKESLFSEIPLKIKDCNIISLLILLMIRKREPTLLNLLDKREVFFIDWYLSLPSSNKILDFVKVNIERNSTEGKRLLRFKIRGRRVSSLEFWLISHFQDISLELLEWDENDWSDFLFSLSFYLEIEEGFYIMENKKEDLWYHNFFKNSMLQIK